ncbi:MAG: 30S ribosomal protein S18 [Candidatus Daviesbacteria bacterium]|nr:30S ribosomal protein S18 [Candidatus Daviesbacteria bacterium]
MATKKTITKKVISQPKESDEDLKEEPQKEVVQKKSTQRCIFCRDNSKPKFTDVATLKKFISDRSRIIPRAKSGICSKHQRVLTKQIKYARHLSLLPFSPQV